MKRAALAIAAALAITGAISAASSSTPTAAPPRRPAPRVVSPTPNSEAGAQAGAIDVARDYVFAARNWTARDYAASWRRQRELATGTLRRQLERARPSQRQLHALRVDHAVSHATIIRADAHLRTRATAQVIVELHERTTTAGQTLDGVSRNQVELERVRDRWHVSGFTMLPGPVTQ